MRPRRWCSKPFPQKSSLIKFPISGKLRGKHGFHWADQIVRKYDLTISTSPSLRTQAMTGASPPWIRPLCPGGRVEEWVASSTTPKPQLECVFDGSDPQQHLNHTLGTSSPPSNCGPILQCIVTGQVRRNEQNDPIEGGRFEQAGGVHCTRTQYGVTLIQWVLVPSV